jgi:hypothetical protein
VNYWETLLFSAAITVVFVKGSLFDGLRKRGPRLWRVFSTCALCVGVWVGAGGDAAARWLPAVFITVFHVIGVGALTGVAALLFVRVSDWLESSAVALDTSSELLKGQRVHAIDCDNEGCVCEAQDG